MKKKKVTSKKSTVKKPTVKKTVAKKTTKRSRTKAKEVVKEVKKVIAPKYKIECLYGISSLVTTKQGLIKEIHFDYTGTLEGISHTVSGSLSVTDIEHPATSKRYDKVQKEDVIDYLLKYVRVGYKEAMVEIIEKELLPETKIITELPW
jgi:hypothetical protein